MEIAERIPSALETLPELRRQNASILETLRQTAEEARGSDAEMASSLRSMSQRMEESRESDRQLVGTLAEFRGSLREMSDSSERTGVAIEQMNVRNEAREAELNSILELTKRWIVIASVVGLVGVAAATAAIIMLFVRGS